MRTTPRPLYIRAKPCDQATSLTLHILAHIDSLCDAAYHHILIFLHVEYIIAVAPSFHSMASLVYHFHPEGLAPMEKTKAADARRARASEPKASDGVAQAVSDKLKADTQPNIRAVVFAQRTTDNSSTQIIGTFYIFNRKKGLPYEAVAKRLLEKADTDLKQVENMIGTKDDYNIFTRRFTNGVIAIIFFSRSYPSRLATNLLEDFEILIDISIPPAKLPSMGENCLTSRRYMYNIIEKGNQLMLMYEEPEKSGMDRIASMQSKIEVATGNCKEAALAVVRNSENLKDVLQQSEALKDQALAYKDKSLELKSQMCRRNIVWTAFLVVGVAAICLGLLSLFHII